MKRIPLLIALGIFSLIAAVIFIYDFKLENKKSAWDLIGQQAVLVYKPTASVNESIRETIEDAARDFLLLKDSSEKRNVIQLLTENENALISLNVIAKDDFDFTFYIPLLSEQDKKRVSTIQNAIVSGKSTQRQRTFEGTVIYEIVSSTKNILAFAIVEDILIVSTTPFLVEDAVRISLIDNPLTFKKSHPELFQLSTVDKDDGNLYINLPEFFRWTKSFADRNTSGEELFFGKSLLTDFKIEDQTAIFNGFAIDSTENEKSFLSLFNKQQPVEFEMKSIISTNTAAVLHYGISQPEDWYLDRDKFFKKNKIAIEDSLEKLSLYNFNAREFYKAIDNEVGLCLINSRKSTNSIFIVELRNITSGLNSLRKLSATLATKNTDSIYSESYSDYEIGKIDLHNFGYNLFWPLGNKSSETYFTQSDDFILFSESDELLKEFLNNIDEENTWGKSLRWNTFLQSTLQESNVDLFFDTNLLSSFFNERLNSQWKSYFDSAHFFDIERGAVQFSKLEKDYYFAGNFPLTKPKTATVKPAAFTNLKFSHDLTSKPFLVRNHDTGNAELIVQDTLNTIFLVGSNGKVDWRLSLDEKIA